LWADLTHDNVLTAADTHLVPALIADAGDPAAWRYIEFFTANIHNPSTRRAYARACGQFSRGARIAAWFHVKDRLLEFGAHGVDGFVDIVFENFLTDFVPQIFLRVGLWRVGR
jgi:hypothetical protein